MASWKFRLGHPSGSGARLPAPDALQAGFYLPARGHDEPNATVHQKYKLEKLGGTNFELIDSLGRDQASYLIQFRERELAARAQEFQRPGSPDRREYSRAPRLIFAGLTTAFVALLLGLATLARQPLQLTERKPRAAVAPPAPLAPLAPGRPAQPVAARKTASEMFASGVRSSQQTAVAKYPALGVAGTPMNRLFLTRLEQWRAKADLRLTHPDWPERLADDCDSHP